MMFRPGDQQNCSNRLRDATATANHLAHFSFWKSQLDVYQRTPSFDQNLDGFRVVDEFVNEIGHEFPKCFRRTVGGFLRGMVAREIARIAFGLFQPDSILHRILGELVAFGRHTLGGFDSRGLGVDHRFRGNHTGAGQQTPDGVSRLGANAEPVPGTLFVDLDGCRFGQRIVVADDFDKTTVTRKTVLSGNDTIAGTLLGASSTKS